MPAMSTQQALRCLGLDETADYSTVRRRFRTLAKQLHPDRNRGATAQFIQLHHAYELLQLRLPQRAERSTCPFCGTHTERLSALLDGRRGCASCLLGQTKRRRRLPGPVIALRWPLVALGTYLAGWLLVTRWVQTDVTVAAAAGLACVWLGIGLLALPMMRKQSPRRSKG